MLQQIPSFIYLLSNLLTLGVPDEGYSRKVLCTLNLTSVFVITYVLIGVPDEGYDEGYSRKVLCTFNLTSIFVITLSTDRCT
jgi:hypothetical protein